MADIDLVIDLAIIMVVAAAVTIIFSKLKQPLIFGYLIAGMIIGPNIPQFALVTDMSLINSLASLGIVLLMFTLGLEFTLGRLRAIGLFAIVIGTIEMSLMIGVGFWIGMLLNLTEGASLLLGAILAISSTAVIVKTMQEYGVIAKQHSQIVVGILVVEDVAAVVMLALISGVGSATHQLPAIALMILSVALFFIVSIAIGILFVPRLVSKVARKMPTEVLLIVALAFCFGLSVLSFELFSSVAIGAFIAGMLIGESEDVDLVVLKMTPIKEMFVAVFFVTMGMLFDPFLLPAYILPVILILLAFIIGKTLLVGTGTLIFGFPVKTAFLAGTGMLALGEFSFIICRAGVDAGMDAGMATGSLYTITVIVATITAFLLPVSVKNGDRMYLWLTRHAPSSLRTTATVLQGSLVSTRTQTKKTPEMKEEFHRRAIMSLVDVALIAIIALGAKVAIDVKTTIAGWVVQQDSFVGILIFICAIALMLPPIISLSRNFEKMIGLVVRYSASDSGDQNVKGNVLRRVLGGVAVTLFGITMMLIALPFVFDRGSMAQLSPVIFLSAIALIILLAWYINKTVYRSFTRHMQRDILKEHVQVTNVSTPAAVEQSGAEKKSIILLEGKDE
jgi:CPA2 family monovalent cation:H+ antiporter-2